MKAESSRVKSPHKKTEAASVIKIDLQALPPMDLFAKHIDAVLAALAAALLRAPAVE
jgi:hypothetical protein